MLWFEKRSAREKCLIIASIAMIMVSLWLYYFEHYEKEIAKYTASIEQYSNRLYQHNASDLPINDLHDTNRVTVLSQSEILPLIYRSKINYPSLVFDKINVDKTTNNRVKHHSYYQIKLFISGDKRLISDYLNTLQNDYSEFSIAHIQYNNEDTLPLLIITLLITVKDVQNNA